MNIFWILGIICVIATIAFYIQGVIHRRNKEKTYKKLFDAFDETSKAYDDALEVYKEANKRYEKLLKKEDDK